MTMTRYLSIVAPGAMVSYQVIIKSFVLPSSLSGLKVVTGGNKLFGTKLEPSVWNSTFPETLPLAVEGFV